PARLRGRGRPARPPSDRRAIPRLRAGRRRPPVARDGPRALPVARAAAARRWLGRLRRRRWPQGAAAPSCPPTLAAHAPRGLRAAGRAARARGRGPGRGPASRAAAVTGARSLPPVRIAAGQGFWGDWLEAPYRQVTGGPIDYLMMDYLAEVTMCIMQKQ